MIREYIEVQSFNLKSQRHLSMMDTSIISIFYPKSSNLTTFQAVILHKKYTLFSISPLNYMMWYSRSNYSSNSWHNYRPPVSLLYRTPWRSLFGQKIINIFLTINRSPF